MVDWKPIYLWYLILTVKLNKECQGTVWIFDLISDWFLFYVQYKNKLHFLVVFYQYLKSRFKSINIDRECNQCLWKFKLIHSQLTWMTVLFCFHNSTDAWLNYNENKTFNFSNVHVPYKCTWRISIRYYFM